MDSHGFLKLRSELQWIIMGPCGILLCCFGSLWSSFSSVFSQPVSLPASQAASQPTMQPPTSQPGIICLYFLCSGKQVVGCVQAEALADHPASQGASQPVSHPPRQPTVSSPASSHQCAQEPNNQHSVTEPSSQKPDTCQPATHHVSHDLLLELFFGGRGCWP
jgi:hypothetical protein